MALDQCIILAVKTNPSDHFLQLRNINPKFENYKCDLTSVNIEPPQPGSGPEWYKYFLCGVKGVFENITGDFPKIGMYVALSGNVPPASGLSSSSALVSSATLATAYAYNVPLDKKHLASISATCERYIGTQGGGMDQAIAYLAKKGCAKFIEFHPELNATSIQLPSSAYFVVANSLAEINKAATSDYNERVVECRTACRILSKKLGFNNWKEVYRFANLQTSVGCSLEQLEELADKELPKDNYTVKDVLEALDVSEDEFSESFLTPNTKHMKNFKLRQRALHVIQESLRVWRFRKTCEASSGELLSEFMEQSHGSLRHLYECSHPSLDYLVDISKEFGIGARLTGAGWGGCIVALCDSMDQCQRYIDFLKEKYYRDLPQAKELDLDNVIFATSPQNGAEIFIF
uniref:GHMP kinase N-terminal domain-containing protein n=1 Tax=Megaselia scalaris TaxID=36166 RepID=T1GSX9_MEGSC